MLVIDGRPMLDIWFEKFADAGVDEVLVNLHHLPDVVSSHVAARTGPPAWADSPGRGRQAAPVWSHSCL